MSQGLEQEVRSWTGIGLEDQREQKWSKDQVYDAPGRGADRLSR